MPTRIKLCGFTRRADVRAAVDAGVDAFGFNFHRASPRFVEPACAVELVAELPPLALAVGLFVNEESAWVEQVLSVVPLAALQFHGNEVAAACERYQRPYLKALRMHDDLDVAAALGAHPRASGWLLDGWDADRAGGTGNTFDWSRVPGGRRDIVLAGGLTPDNVGEAIRSARPMAVDAASGVEAEPGVKDVERMQAFVAAVRSADAAIASEISDGPGVLQEQ